MISLSRFDLLFLLLVTATGAAAQQTTTTGDEVYGADPLLYNGKFYTYHPPQNTIGNQFFSDRQFEIGSLRLRGVGYTDQMLNYDIYNQQLILKYTTRTGTVNQIIVPDSWLETFSFKGCDFEMISTQLIQNRIFQVLGNGPIRILYFWKKNLNLESFPGANNHTFSVAVKEMNLFKDNQILKYWNNKSFSALFDPEKRNFIKGYLRRHKINVKKAADQSITELIYYCNTL